MTYTEDTLVQQTTADYLEQQLDWQSVYAWNNEEFGPDSLLGRTSDRKETLSRSLHNKLITQNRACRMRPTTMPCVRSPPPSHRRT